MHPFLAALAAGLPRDGFWGGPVIAAVSGGADSVAMLLGLVRLAPATARIVVAHADHGLRPESAADAEFVAALAARLAVPCESRRLALHDGPAGGGEGAEGRARRLRYEFLVAVAHARGARHVVVGHTADDQAETILHRALRGTGVVGLAGMRPGRALGDGVALVRPMLGVPRALARAFLGSEGQGWREDPTNADLRHARNFLRHQVLARAEGGPYPAASAALVRLGEQAAAVATTLDSAARHLLEAHVRRQAEGVVVDAAAIAGLDRRLLAQMFVVLWEREGWPRRDMTARHFEDVADLVVRLGRDGEPVGAARDMPAGVRVTASANRRLALQRRTRRAATAQ